MFVRNKRVNETNKRTEFVEDVLFTNRPCKLSFETLTVTAEAGNVSTAAQGVRLFLDNDVSVPAGSRVEVIRDGKTYTYKASSEPGVFTNHQEIRLELFEGRA